MVCRGRDGDNQKGDGVDRVGGVWCYVFPTGAVTGNGIAVGSVWLSGVRWAIEQCFEETKTELGMAHYEVRKYPGWYHHMLTSMLAHFFLWHLKLRLGEKSSSADSVAAADVIGSRLAPAYRDD